MPTRVGAWSGIGPSGAIVNNPTSADTPYQVSGLTSTNCSILNYLWTDQGIGLTDQQIIDKQGRFMNIRAEYNTALQSPTYPDTNLSNIQSNPKVLNQTWNVQNMLAVNNSSGYNPKAPYEISIPNTIT